MSNQVHVLWAKPGRQRGNRRYAEEVEAMAQIPKALGFIPSRKRRIDRGGLGEWVGEIKFWQKWRSKRLCVFRVKRSLYL